jgi:hypothetical protein
VGEDGRIVGGEGWQEKVRNREEWQRLLRMARNHRILHTPIELMNGVISGVFLWSFNSILTLDGVALKLNAAGTAVENAIPLV